MTHFPGVCLDCQDRHIGCHGSCEKYQNAKQRYEIINAKRKKAERINDDMYRLKLEGISSMGKKKNSAEWRKYNG